MGKGVLRVAVFQTQWKDNAATARAERQTSFGGGGHTRKNK